MNEYRRPVWAEVDLGAIKRNIDAIRALLPPRTRLMAVVKANAYGHGLVPVARAAEAGGGDWLGVALLEEGLTLRQAGLKLPIQVLSEVPPEAADALLANDLTATVYSKELAAALSAGAGRRGRPAPVHLKIDTGMHRVGLRPAAVPDFFRYLKTLPGLEVEGVFTHFALADQPTDPYTTKQLNTFLSLRSQLPPVPIWHAASSAATLFLPESHLDMVRIGIALYGLQPSTTMPAPVALAPALALKARLAFVQNLAAGEGVSYGLTYRASRPMQVGVIPIGYGDGYSRLLSNRADVLIGGRRVKIVGNICMDQLLVALGDVKAAGAEATLIGSDGSERITAEELAGILGTINYEIVCMLSDRVPRVYVS